MSMLILFFFLMIRPPPRSTPLYSSAASDVYKRQINQYAAADYAEYSPHINETGGSTKDVNGVSSRDSAGIRLRRGPKKGAAKSHAYLGQSKEVEVLSQDEEHSCRSAESEGDYESGLLSPIIDQHPRHNTQANLEKTRNRDQDSDSRE